MRTLLRHKLIVGGVLVALAASAGGAYAATQSNTNSRQAYLNDVARRLNVSPAQLNSALKGALIDRLNALVKAGRLTQAQANKIEQRIDKGGGRLRFFFGGGGRLRPFLRAGLNGPLQAAASYLGLTNAQLIGAVRSGQSLAQIAKSHGKSVSGLEQAITSAEKTRLDKLVANGTITSAQEQRALSRLSARIDRLVNRTGFGRMASRLPQGAPMQGAPMQPPPGAASGAPPMFGSPSPTT